MTRCLLLPLRRSGGLDDVLTGMGGNGRSLVIVIPGSKRGGMTVVRRISHLISLVVILNSRGRDSRGDRRGKTRIMQCMQCMRSENTAGIVLGMILLQIRRNMQHVASMLILKGGFLDLMKRRHWSPLCLFGVTRQRGLKNRRIIRRGMVRSALFPVVLHRSN